VRGSIELIPLKDLLLPLGVTATTDSRKASVSLVYQGREVILYDR
jgi:hypothetical protein